MAYYQKSKTHKSVPSKLTHRHSSVIHSSTAHHPQAKKAVSLTHTPRKGHHLSTASREKLEAYLRSPKEKAIRHAALERRLHSPAYRAKEAAQARQRWLRLSPEKKRKIVLYLLMKSK